MCVPRFDSKATGRTMKKKKKKKRRRKNVLALNTNDKRMTTVIPLAAPLPYRTHFSYDKRKNGRMPRRQVAFTIKPTDTRFKFLSPRRGWTADQTWTGHEKSSSIFHVDPLKSYHHRSSKPLPRPVHHDDTWSMTRNDKNYLTTTRALEIFRDDAATRMNFLKFSDSSVINELFKLFKFDG